MWTYGCVPGDGDLLSQTHKKNIGTCGDPVVLEVLLGLGPDVVVGRLKSLEQGGHLGRHLAWQDRHRDGRQMRNFGYRKSGYIVLTRADVCSSGRVFGSFGVGC